MTPRKIPLKVVTAPAIGVVLEAPPVLVASEHSVDYVCAVAPPFYCMPTRDKLMGSLIHCAKCGSYNLTEA